MEKIEQTKKLPSKITKKCNICRKKSLVNITCTKCDKIFCIKHCCPENHNCIHDYKRDFQIAEKIITPKIEVI